MRLNPYQITKLMNKLWGISWEHANMLVNHPLTLWPSRKQLPKQSTNLAICKKQTDISLLYPTVSIWLILNILESNLLIPLSFGGWRSSLTLQFFSRTAGKFVTIMTSLLDQFIGGMSKCKNKRQLSSTRIRRCNSSKISLIL